MPLSQEKRLRAAINAVRALVPATPLNASERSQLARRLLAEKWTRRNFTTSRFTITPSWRGTELDTLHELAMYLVPRATWARPRSSGESWTRRESVFAFVALVQHKFGREAATNLRAALRENGVKYRPRRKLTAAQREALKGQQFKKKVAELTATLGAPGPRKAIATAIVAATERGRRRITFDDE